MLFGSPGELLITNEAMIGRCGVLAFPTTSGEGLLGALSWSDSNSAPSWECPEDVLSDVMLY